MFAIPPARKLGARYARRASTDHEDQEAQGREKSREPADGSRQVPPSLGTTIPHDRPLAEIRLAWRGVIKVVPFRKFFAMLSATGDTVKLAGAAERIIKAVFYVALDHGSTASVIALAFAMLDATPVIAKAKRTLDGFTQQQLERDTKISKVM